MQSRIDNPETLAAAGAQETGRMQTKQLIRFKY
jgi:hypothetical protein